jgi:hypothetical protein
VGPLARGAKRRARGSRSFPSGPWGGKGKPVDRTVGGTQGGCTGTRNRVNETPTDSKTGRRASGQGVYFVGSSPRSGEVGGSVPPDAQGGRGGCGRPDGRRLTANLQGLLERAKSGFYQAPPVRRVHIPKGDGRRTRPIGIPTFEDKVLQRAVAMALEPWYEQDFLECSYGYRPNRSAHQAFTVSSAR